MKENAAFENSLKLSRITLLLSGISIYPKEFKASAIFFINCLFYFNFLWVYTDVLGEFCWLIEGIILGKKFSQLSLIAPCITICLLATAKSTPIYYNRQLLVKVVNKLREIHPATEIDDEANVFNKTDDIPTQNDMNVNFIETTETEGKNSEVIERQIVEDSTKFLDRVILFTFYSNCVVVIVFSLQPMVTMICEYYAKGKTDLKFPFFAKYFFDPFTKSRFPFMYFHQVWSTFIVAFNAFGADSFHCFFCTYVQMHFRILSHRFENMISRSPSKTRERLVSLVRRHQELIELVDKMEILYSKSTLFHIISSSVLICLSGFNVTVLVDKGAVIPFTTFLIKNLARIFMLCFFGDMVMRSSAEVSEAICKCRWYDTDARTKQSIFIILMRSQKPCRLTTSNFANLNISVFTTILSRSWSYFALLRTMYN